MVFIECTDGFLVYAFKFTRLFSFHKQNSVCVKTFVSSHWSNVVTREGYVMNCWLMKTIAVFSLWTISYR